MAADDTPDEILVASEPDRYRAAAVAKGTLVDAMSVGRSDIGTPGSVYLGRVVRRAAGMNAAFVEIGLDRPAFLNLGKDTPGEGKAIAVQMVEEASGDKAARVSTRIALEGRFVVLLPRDKGVAPSRRLDAAVARRLTDLARPLLEAGEGIVVRAAGAHASPDQIATELATLRALWQSIDAKLAGTPPACAHAEHGLRRILCTFGGAPSATFSFTDAAAARTAQRLAATIAPDLAKRIVVAEEGNGLFDRHGVADALATAEDSEVALPSGGRLTIEATRALTAVDVDSGAGSTAAEAALATNIEAAGEVARQLRLRELGGPVVVDFIRMQRKGDHEKVRRRLAEAVASDRMGVQLLGWTPGGLFELARARAGHA
jgi:ribonuclease G